MPLKANTIVCLKAQKKFNDNIICATFSPPVRLNLQAGLISQLL